MSNRCPTTKQLADRTRRLTRKLEWDGWTLGEKALLLTGKATIRDLRRARANAAEIAKEAA